jgi:hypothetical protein
MREARSCLSAFRVESIFLRTAPYVPFAKTPLAPSLLKRKRQLHCLVRSKSNAIISFPACLSRSTKVARQKTPGFSQKPQFQSRCNTRGSNKTHHCDNQQQREEGTSENEIGCETYKPHRECITHHISVIDGYFVRLGGKRARLCLWSAHRPYRRAPQ